MMVQYCHFEYTMKEELYNSENFYSISWHSEQESFYYDKCLEPQHLKPIEEFLLEDRELSPFSEELSIYAEASKCVLEFDIYTIETAYRRGNKDSVELMMDCYRMATKDGISEAYNNIGVYLAMTDRMGMALPYWKKAALGGSCCGWINLLGYFESIKSNEDLLLCLNKLETLNHPIGCWNLAVANHFGNLGLEPNIDNAKSLYKKMMMLTYNKKAHSVGTEDVLLQPKAMANYNLAKIRLLTEEHTKDNLEDILNSLTSPPYVMSKGPRERELIADINRMIKRL